MYPVLCQDHRSVVEEEREPESHNTSDVDGALGSTNGGSEDPDSASDAGDNVDNRARSRSPGAGQRGDGAGDHGLSRAGEECMEENTGR